MDPEIKLVGSMYSSEWEKKELHVHEREHPSQRARFAMAMIEKWGMIKAEDGGEDSSGRAKLKLSEIDDVVIRACDLSSKAFDEFEKRGWMSILPSIDEIYIERCEKEKA